MKMTISGRRVVQFASAALLVVLAGSLLRGVPAASQKGPVPTTKMPVPAGREVATLAAGCFWSMEAIFKQLKGVDKVVPGYAGGTLAKPSYEQVETGNTGHAETINIIFDPKQISYNEVLQVLLTVRNPTTLNRQGPDEGPQYRSVIFYHSDQQKRAANEAIHQAQHVWNAPIVTEVKPFANFYEAEAYHHDYYRLHPDEPYCAGVIKPELDEFQAKFKSKLKS